MNRSSFNARIFLLAGGIALIFFLYGLCLADMQIVKGEQYAAQAQSTSSLERTLKAARGEMVDCNGTPLVVNEICYDVIFEKAYMPKGEENEIILRLFALFEEEGQEWIDNLPITSEAPFVFLEGRESDIQRLREDMGLQSWATVANVLDEMAERYGLEDYSPQTRRMLAGVRYEMERQGYSVNVSYTFAADVSKTMITKISERNSQFPGVREKESTTRHYLSGDLAPWVIGQIGPLYREEYEEYRKLGYQMNDVIGKDGVERAFEQELRGQDGKQLIYMENGIVVDIQDEQETIPGHTIQLTLDMDLQRAVQDALEEQVLYLREHAEPTRGQEARGAVAVVIEVKTGAVKALGNYPSYDLGTYRQNYSELASDPLTPLFNRALQGLYTPGSVYKPGVSVAALAEEIITPTSTVDCQGRYTYYEDYQPGCTGYHREISVRNAIMQSCNIFFYDVGRRLGIEAINRYSTWFGFGQATGIELYEETGRLASPELSAAWGNTWTPGNVIQASIGQSDTAATPLQLACYAATIANKGVRMKPHLIQSVNTYNCDSIIRETQPEVICQMDVAPEVFQVVTEGMMQMSTYGFADYPIKVATKTGSPQIDNIYTNSTFISFAPADDPEIAVAVVVEYGGGESCAPIVRKIYNAYFGIQDPADQPEGRELSPMEIPVDGEQAPAVPSEE